MEASVNILYNNKNITVDLARYLLSFSYTDKVAGESDEVTLVLEDADKNWRGPWKPAKGATIMAEIVYGGKKLGCGVFTIDELELSKGRGGDTVTIKGLATSISKGLRTKKSYAHADKTLRQVAQTVATGAGLKLQGQIADILLGRLHQYHETDLNFLNRIGRDYGYVFSVRGDLLIFTHYTQIEERQPSLTLYDTDMLSFTLRDKSNSTYKESKVQYYNQKEKRLVSDGSTSADEVATTDSLEIRQRTESEAQAKEKSKAVLHQANSKQVEARFTTMGNLLLVSGNNVQLPDLGGWKGTYHIEESTHSLSRDNGYEVSVSAKKVK